MHPSKTQFFHGYCWYVTPRIQHIGYDFRDKKPNQNTEKPEEKIEVSSKLKGFLENLDNEEKYLIRNIDNNQWNTSLSRRTQHYGYLYDYRSRQALIPTNAIPDWSTFVINRLVDKNIINFIAPKDPKIAKVFIFLYDFYGYFKFFHLFKAYFRFL